MATFGTTVADTTAENVATDGMRYSEGVMPEGGTLTEFTAFLQSGIAGTESWRFAVYQGGAEGDPTGASLIWDSGNLNSVNVNASRYWTATELGATVSGTLTAVRTWLCIKVNDGEVGLEETNRGDFASGSLRSAAINNDATTAFPATWPSESGTTGAEAIKAYITYTTSSAATATPGVGAVTLNGRLPTTSNFSNVRIRDVLVSESGQLVANLSGADLLVWYAGYPIGAPDVSLANMTSDSEGTISWSIPTGTLAFNQAIFYVATSGDTSPSAYTCARVTPSYE